MTAVANQREFRLTYYGPIEELEALHEWKQVIVKALDKFRRHCIEFRNTTRHGPWRKELNITPTERFDWAFAEGVRLKGLMSRRDNIAIKVEVSDDEREITFSYDRPGSKYRIWITINLKA